jgi:alpha-glucosidase (family GH31 glycosyl hydrolase)
MIEHQPYGIDDPYKHLPTERVPRDPEAQQPFQIGFRTAEGVRGAWIQFEDGAQVAAQTLGGGLWLAQVDGLAPGSYRYTIHTNDEHSPDFSLEVAAWQAAVRGLEAVQHETGVAVRLEVAGGSDAWLGLSVPQPGVVRLEFGRRSAPRATGLPCTVKHDGTRVQIAADGIELELDLETLAIRLRHPQRSAWQVHASAALRWLESADGSVTRVQAQFTPSPDESLHGLGERFDASDRRGRRYDVRVYEEYKEQGTRTYLPVPFVVSSAAYGVWLEADEPSAFDLRGEACVVELEQRPTPDPHFRLHLIVAPQPYAVTAAFVKLNGGIAVPPRWAFGPWMSSNDWNSQAKTEAVVRRTLEEDVPATALVLEAWSDESTFYVFHDAEYTPKTDGAALTLNDFRFGGRWPDPKGLVDECHASGIRVLLWQIPVYRATADDRAPEHTRLQHAADEAHMVAKGCSVLEADGSPYRCRGWWFTNGLVMDFTHPEGSAWWFDKRRYLFDELGIDGMKTDGGEHLWGRDLRVHDGRRGLEMFNAYPNSYVGAYHAYIAQHTGNEGMTFSRAGYTGAGRFPAHWAGDENSTWSAYKASIQAGLSAGISGVSMWAWDIGGFSGDIPTVELYLRSTAMACFCPIMQYHSEFNPCAENRDRSPWNISERHNDPRALEVYRRYAKLRMRLLDAILADAVALSAQGLPMMRDPRLEFPDARALFASDPHSYLLGRDLFVCPVVEKGASARTVRLPPGEWLDLWSGARFAGKREYSVPAPLERIPVFVRASSERLGWWLEVAQSL